MPASPRRRRAPDPRRRSGDSRRLEGADLAAQREALLRLLDGDVDLHGLTGEWGPAHGAWARLAARIGVRRQRLAEAWRGAAVRPATLAKWAANAARATISARALDAGRARAVR